MAAKLKELHGRLKSIKENLVKIGPTRRIDKVKEEKLSLTNLLYDEYCKIKEIIEKETAEGKYKTPDVESIEILCSDIKSYYIKITELCTVTEVERKTGKMERFELKTAVSLLPLMNDEEKVTKQLISNIEMYDQMLESSGKQSLITFVLKSRLSESAKLRMSETYSSVSELLTDMRQHLLSKKSDTTIQKRLQHTRQNRMSVEDYGKQIEDMFVDLTISQANGDQSKYDVLKPINEKNAIKIFSDGLRNNRTSIIVASRNYKSLKEAIQGALDEELHSTGTQETQGQVLSYHRARGRSNFHNDRNFHQQGHNSFRTRSSFRGPPRGRGTYYNNYSYQNNRFENDSRNWTRGRGHGRSYTRGNNNRGFRWQNNEHQVNVAQTSNEQNSNTPQTTETHNLFFRA